MWVLTFHGLEDVLNYFNHRRNRFTEKWLVPTLYLLLIVTWELLIDCGFQELLFEFLFYVPTKKPGSNLLLLLKHHKQVT